MADDLDPVRGGHDLAGPAARDIATRFDGEIDDDRPRRHPGNHRLGHQHRRLPPRDQRGADHDVDPSQRLADLLALAALVVFAHFAGVAGGGLGRARRLLVDRDEGGAEALDLLLGGGSDIGGADDRAEAAGGGDRLQAGHPGAHHQDPGGLDRAGCGHHHRQGAAEFGGGVEHRPVAGEVGLGGQHVHCLGPRDARDQLHREGGDPGRGIGLDFGRAAQGLQQADQRRAALHEMQLVDAVGAAQQGPLHFEHDVGLGQCRGGVGDNRRARRAVRRIEKTRLGPGPVFDDGMEPHSGHVFDGVGGGRHAPLLRAPFLDDGDLHRGDGSLLQGPVRRTAVSADRPLNSIGLSGPPWRPREDRDMCCGRFRCAAAAGRAQCRARLAL